MYNMYTHIELVMEFENQLTGGHHSVGRRENGPSGAHPEQDIGASPRRGQGMPMKCSCTVRLPQI